jgi:predicted transcriptional regulator
MVSKMKTREITIIDNEGAFSVFFKKLATDTQLYDFDGLAALRKLLSNERAKMLHILKVSKPNSIYDLAKKLGRNFKSVSDDIKLLERFGFVSMEAEKTGKRNRLKPVLAVNAINIVMKI